MEISSPSQLFQTYLKMLMEYSQRRSGLDNDTFNEVIEQLNPDLEMASKTIFDRVEERAFARGEAKADQKVQEADQKVPEANQKVQEIAQKAQEAEQKIRKAVINLIQKTNMTDEQIAEIQEVELPFVQSIREELKG